MIEILCNECQQELGTGDDIVCCDCYEEKVSESNKDIELLSKIKALRDNLDSLRDFING